MTEQQTAAMRQTLEAWQTSVYGSKSHHKAMLLAMTNMAQALKPVVNQQLTTEQPAAWVGLTDNETFAIFDSIPTQSCQSYEHWRSLVAYAIEAKLREKNGGVA